jgi:superfamily II DNA helicase RecQ
VPLAEVCGRPSNRNWYSTDAQLLWNKHIWVLWDEIQAGASTRILMSPEQATNHRFKMVLRSPELHAMLGLLAIDELHIVSKWRGFCPEFTYLYSLRSLIPRAVHFFGWTATLDRDSQAFIIEKAGFNQSRLDII